MVDTGGRPTKCTPKRRKLICDAMRIGAHRPVAAARAGIELRTLERWLQWGEAARSRGDRTPATLPYRRFCREFRAAETEAELGIIADVRIGTRKQPRAGIELLARRHPDRWARRDQLEVSGSVSVAVDESMARDALMRAMERMVAESVAASPEPMQALPSPAAQVEIVSEPSGRAEKVASAVGSAWDLPPSLH
jgi:hypothetical protein